jgi:hypothetical protein
MSFVIPGNSGLPRYSGGSAPTSPFSRPAQRSLTLRPTRSPSRLSDPLHHKLRQSRYLHCRSDCYRLERPVAGWELHPLEISTFHGALGNKGYRKFLRTRAGGGFEIDEAKVAWEARFDGKWVLRTDTELSPTDCALRYKDLWIVEQSFRSFKSVLETRPIYHKCDETIRGHVFCSFLALMLLKELLGRIERRGWQVEWERLRDDLDALEEITIHTAGRSFVVRSATQGAAGKAVQAAGVALGSPIRLLDDGPPLPPAQKRARSAKDLPR